MEYATQEQFKEDIIIGQDKRENEIYVVTRCFGLYKLWKITKGSKKKLAENRQGSVIWGMIPCDR